MGDYRKGFLDGYNEARGELEILNATTSKVYRYRVFCYLCLCIGFVEMFFFRGVISFLGFALACASLFHILNLDERVE